MGLLDYGTLLYDPNYLVFGVDAVLILDGGFPVSIVVIDKTDGIDLGSSTEIQTIVPAAVCRSEDLAAIDYGLLEDAEITFSGKTWRVKSYRSRPSPDGRADGETYLILSES